MSKRELTTTFLGFSLILIMTLGILKFAVLDQPVRHKRFWQELRLLASLSERQRLFSAAETIHNEALDQANQLSADNVRTAISLADLGCLYFQLKEFDKALRILQKSKQIIDELRQSPNPDCDKRLALSESVRIQKQIAKCLAKMGKQSAAAIAYKSTIRTCEEEVLLSSPVDLICIEDFIDAFLSLCRLAPFSQAAAQAELISTTVDWKVLSPILPGWAQKSLMNKYRELLKSKDKLDDEDRMKLSAQLEKSLGKEKPIAFGQYSAGVEAKHESF